MKTIEERRSEAREVYAASFEKSPTRESWGLFSYGDAPGFMGGGVGGFTWFDSREAMLDFVWRLLPTNPPGPADLDTNSICEQTRALVEELRAGTLEDELAREQINNVLVGFSQITWWGRFDDLLKGNEPFPKTMRRYFRDEESDETIEEEELEEFLELLQDYGL